jgi:hypothetical protein
VVTEATTGFGQEHWPRLRDLNGCRRGMTCANGSIMGVLLGLYGTCGRLRKPGISAR